MFFVSPMYIFFAIWLWLLINYFTGWMPFSTILCIFAGIFLVMPSLLQFTVSDFSCIVQHKKLTWITVLRNVLIVPFLFVLPGILFFADTPAVLYSLLVLGVLPWWGLLMSWLKQSHAHITYGFSLFVMNMTIFVCVFLWVHYLITTFVSQIPVYDTVTQSCALDVATSWVVSCWSWSTLTKPLLAYLFLIILPFFLSRIIRYFSIFQKKIQAYIPFVSQIATFFIVWYIFSLESIHTIFDQSILYFLRVFFTVLLGYLFVFFVTYLLYKKLSGDVAIQKAFFWNSTIRFVTLWVVFGALYVPLLWPVYILVFASAYFVQTILSKVTLKYLH